MKAFIINLDRSQDRWDAINVALKGTTLTINRVPAIDGHNLTQDDYHCSESGYRFFNGRPSNLMELACYLSHLKAINAFLNSKDEHALICEDDIQPEPGLDEVVQHALEFRHSWNILRLTGLTDGKPIRVRKLSKEYSLCVSVGRLKGTGAYIVDREAAKAFVFRLLPMKLPYDHAMDREWWLRLRAAYILPFPVSQVKSGFKSLIQKYSTKKYSFYQRSLSTYPYQVLNESSRWIFRGVCAASYLFRQNRS